jgi:hypothetical protein
VVSGSRNGCEKMIFQTKKNHDGTGKLASQNFASKINGKLASQNFASKIDASDAGALTFRRRLSQRTHQATMCYGAYFSTCDGAYFPTREAADSYLPGAGASASQTIGAIELEAENEELRKISRAESVRASELEAENGALRRTLAGLTRSLTAALVAQSSSAGAQYLADAPLAQFDTGSPEDSTWSELRVSTVFPRHKTCDDQRDFSVPVPVYVTLEALEQLSSLSLPKAASKLGISATAMKKACRKLGITRWPYFPARHKLVTSTIPTRARLPVTSAAPTPARERVDKDVQIKFQTDAELLCRGSVVSPLPMWSPLNHRDGAYSTPTTNNQD